MRRGIFIGGLVVCLMAFLFLIIEYEFFDDLPGGFLEVFRVVFYKYYIFMSVIIVVAVAFLWFKWILKKREDDSKRSI